MATKMGFIVPVVRIVDNMRLRPNEYRIKIDDGLDEDWPDQVPPQYAPSGRILEPAQVADAAVYWVGDESRPVSGTVLELEQYPVIGRNPFKEW